MNRLLFVLCITLGHVSNAQVAALPTFKEGKWLLVDTNGQRITSTSYEYIHTLDAANTTFYANENKFGIVNAKGQELTSAIYNDIIPYNYGVYAVQDSLHWQLISTFPKVEVLIDEQVQNVKHLGTKWIEFDVKSDHFLMHIPSKTLYKTGKDFQVRFAAYEYVLVRINDSIQSIYTPENTLMVTGKCSMSFWDPLLSIQTPNGMFCIDENGQWKLPFIVRNFNFVNADNIYFTNGQKGILYERSTRKPLLSGPYTRIEEWDSLYYKTFDETYENLLSKSTNNLLLPKKYQTIFPYGDLLLASPDRLLNEVLYKNGRPVLSGLYSNVNITGNWLKLYLKTTSGLFSMKSKQLILPCLYDRITIHENRIKAFSENNYVALEISKEHQVLRQIEGQNAVKINTVKSVAGKKFNYDIRLLPLGWYIDSTVITNAKGEQQMSYKWGLKGANDSVILTPKFSEMKYLEGPFSLWKSGKSTFSYSDSWREEYVYFQAFSYTTGKKAGPSNIVYIDTSDFKTKTYARYSTPKSFGFLFEDGKHKEVQYIQQDHAAIIRYCTDGKIEISNEDDIEESTELNLICFQNHRQAISPYIQNNTAGKRTVFKDAKWNFMLPSGQALSEEHFEFAHPFVGAHAIVKKEGKWGVISVDSTILPFVYSHIERVIIGKDTLFIAEQTPAGTRILDTTLHELTDYKQFIQSKGKLSVLKTGKRYTVVDEHYRPLAESESTIKLLNNGYFTIKRKKEIDIYDPNGTIQVTTKRSIAAFTHPSVFVFEDKNNFGVANIMDEEVLAPTFRKIEIIDQFILADGATGKIVFSIDGKLLFSYKSGEIFIDSISHQFLHYSEGKMTFYSSIGKKRSKLKGLKPNSYINQALIYDNIHPQIVSETGSIIQQFDLIEGMVTFPNGMLCIKSDNKGWLLFDRTWKMVQPQTSSVRKIHYHGKDVFSFLMKDGSYTLVNLESGKQLEHLHNVAGDLNEGCLSAKKRKILLLY